MQSLKSSYVTLKNGEKLFYQYRKGSRDPLILIHGNLFSSAIFEPLIHRLDNDLTLYAIDLRGFGKSSYENEAKEVKDYTLDVKNFIEHLSLKNVNILGLDFGALIAMRLGVDHKALINTLLLISSYSVAGRSIKKRKLGGLIKSKAPIQRLDELKKYVEPVEKYKHKNQRWFIKQMLNKDVFTTDKPLDTLYEKLIDAFIAQRNLAEVYYAMTYFNIFSDDNGVVEGEHKAKTLNMPILSIHGDKNEAIPAGVAKFNERAIGKNVETHILNGVSHVPFIDDDKYVADLMMTFLDKHSKK